MQKLISQLKIIKMNNIKPNYAELGREYERDPRTVKKYYEGYTGKKKSRKKGSKLDKYEEIIREKMAIKGVTIRGVYQYLVNTTKDENIGSYVNFQIYVKKRGMKATKSAGGHPRYETPAGKQAQIDWKEEITLHSRGGKAYEFNVFNYKLSCSRYCWYEYKITKTRQDVYESLIEAFKETGGIPEEILCDNMATIVDIYDGNKRKVNEKFKQFAKDFGFEVKLCKPKHAYTKGKVESNNKFINWLKPYEGEFEDENELKSIIKTINTTVNTQICQATGVPPMLLYQEEKESLKLLPNDKIIQYYLDLEKALKVEPDSLVYYKKQRYSVPQEYIGKSVFVKEETSTDGQTIFINIYYQEKQIASHIAGKKRINYREDDYLKLMKTSSRSEDIEQYAKANLKIFDKLLWEEKE